MQSSAEPHPLHPSPEHISPSPQSSRQCTPRPQRDNDATQSLSSRPSQSRVIRRKPRLHVGGSESCLVGVAVEFGKLEGDRQAICLQTTQKLHSKKLPP